MRWQPIETAPKDGTVVDLWTIDGERIPDAFWVERLGYFMDSTGESYPAVEFTHFMLITPPGEQQPDRVNQRLLDAAEFAVLACKENLAYAMVKKEHVLVEAHDKLQAAIEAAKQATKV